MSLKPGLILFGADCDYWILLPRSQDLSPLFVNVAKKKARDIIDKSNMPGILLIRVIYIMSLQI